jgi:hypothetical protein
MFHAGDYWKTRVAILRKARAALSTTTVKQIWEDVYAEIALVGYGTVSLGIGPKTLPWNGLRLRGVARFLRKAKPASSRLPADGNCPLGVMPSTKLGKCCAICGSSSAMGNPVFAEIC